MRAIATQTAALTEKQTRRQRPRRANRSSEEAQMSLLAPIANSHAVIAWKLACCALVPFVGLLLGPIALVLGIIGWRRFRRQPEVLGIRHAIGGVILGLMTTVCNYLGTLSLAYGLRDVGVF